jgi:hypothetical protein
MDETSTLLRAAKNEAERDMDRFNAANLLAALGYTEEAADAFAAIADSNTARDEVRQNATHAIQQVRRGEVPEDMSEVMPAPIDSGPPRPPRPL